MLNSVWCEKYRPQTIEECVLPPKTQAELQQMIERDELPNMMFVGTPGIGKSAAAEAILRETGHEYIKINCSLEGNIDIIRTRVTQFGSTVSFNGKRKYVIYEEVDGLSEAAQRGLRAFIEEYSANCGHIFTGNNVHKLDPAIFSRTERVNFVFANDEKKLMARSMFAMIEKILQGEGIEYQPTSIQHLLVHYLKRSTDLRQLIILVQKFSRSGEFYPDLSSVANVRLQPVIDVIKSQKVNPIRTWVGENSDIDYETIFTFLYENVDLIARPDGIAPMIAHIAEHQSAARGVANPEIQVAACLLDIASECV